MSPPHAAHTRHFPAQPPACPDKKGIAGSTITHAAPLQLFDSRKLRRSAGSTGCEDHTICRIFCHSRLDYKTREAVIHAQPDDLILDKLHAKALCASNTGSLELCSRQWLSKAIVILNFLSLLQRTAAARDHHGLHTGPLNVKRR